MKRLLLIFLTLILLLSAAACTPKEPATTTPSTATPPATTAPKPLSALTASEAVTLLDTLAKQSRTTLTLSVTTVTDGITLRANYNVTPTEVRYSIEKLSLFPTDGDFSSLPESFITTLTGTATVQNGTVTAIDGTAVTLPALGTLQGRFAFPASALRNVVWEEGILSADVISADAVLSTTANVSNMKIAAALSTDAITSLTVTYATSKSDVTMVYTF